MPDLIERLESIDPADTPCMAKELATEAAREIEKLRAALFWSFDRLSIDDMTKREQQRTMLEIGNVLTGKPSPAATYVPNDWDDSANLKTATR